MSVKGNTDFTKVPETKTLAGHTIWNLIGMGLPLLVGLIALRYLPDPKLGLGRAKMELLGIVWLLVGFSSIFDMGLGRALTKLFVDKLSTDKNEDLHGLFWTAVLMITGIGLVVSCIVVLVIAPPPTPPPGPPSRADGKRNFLAFVCQIVSLMNLLASISRIDVATDDL